MIRRTDVPGSLQQGCDPSYCRSKNVDTLHGVSFWCSEMGVHQIADGMSKTYLIGEKYVMVDQYFTGGHGAENETALTGFNNDNFRCAAALPERDRLRLNDTYSFGSAHTGGVNFVFCDGSVHTIAFDIDLDIHQALAHRADQTGLESGSFQWSVTRTASSDSGGVYGSFAPR